MISILSGRKLPMLLLMCQLYFTLLNFTWLVFFSLQARVFRQMEIRVDGRCTNIASCGNLQ